MPAPQLLAILLGLLAGAPGDVGDAVTAARLDVFDAAGGAAIRTGALRRGDRVQVRRVEGEWLAIAPPAGSFSWVDARAIREEGDGKARVVADRAPVRPASPGAHLPGPPGCVLERGEVVRLADRRPLTIGPAGKGRTWRAIEPPSEEVRFVRAEGVARREEDEPIPVASGRMRLAALATVAPGADDSATLDPALREKLAAIEGDHRTALGAALEDWDLAPIRARYRALLEGATDPAAKAAVQLRLDQVARQETLSKDARDLRTALDRSRGRDAAVAAVVARKAKPRRAPAEPYDATGLLQPSSKQVHGQRVYALISADGDTAGYLDLPAALDPSTMVGHQVGVRGEAHFDADLNARLYDVRDLEALGD